MLTDLPGDLVTLEAAHCARARVEDRIRDAKDTALRNLPCGDFDRKHVWPVIVLVALTFVCWTQPLLLTGDLALARPPTLRYRIWHTAARIARTAAARTTLRYRIWHTAARIARHGHRTHVRLAADSPWATELRDAFTRLWALPAPAG